MKKINYFHKILIFFFIFLPIYPHSNSIDFRGVVDPSLILIFLFPIIGTNFSRVLVALLVGIFYLVLSDEAGYIDFFSKILVFILSAYFINKYYWEAVLKDIILTLSILLVYFVITLFLYKVIFHVALLDYLVLIGLPFIYNAIISIILLFMIKYTSWPSYPEPPSQS